MEFILISWCRFKLHFQNSSVVVKWSPHSRAEELTAEPILQIRVLYYGVTASEMWSNRQGNALYASLMFV